MLLTVALLMLQPPAAGAPFVYFSQTGWPNKPIAQCLTRAPQVLASSGHPYQNVQTSFFGQWGANASIVINCVQAGTGYIMNIFGSSDLSTADAQNAVVQIFTAMTASPSAPSPPSAPPAANSIRINAGGPRFVDAAGQVWDADRGFSVSGTYTGTSPVTGTPDGPVYQTTRQGNFTYTLAVPNGAHVVTLQFAELYFGGAGNRSFNVLINGQTALTNFDVFAQAGGRNRPLDRSFNVTVTNGQVAIQFVPVKNQAILSGIEIR